MEKDLYGPYKSKGFVVLAICLDADKAQVLDIVSSLGLSYSVIPDRDGLISGAYDANPMDAPVNIIIDKKGIIRYREYVVDPDAMRELIEELL